MAYIQPQTKLKSFTCPHCGVLSRQYHWGYGIDINGNALSEKHANFDNTVARLSKCEHCDEIAIWYKSTLVYPDFGPAPAPNPEMPDEVKADYQEASTILSRSPRGAAALLRLAIQKLFVHLGGSGKTSMTTLRNL